MQANSIMKYNSGAGSLRGWLVKESRFDSRYVGKCEAIFTQGNGYLGVRSSLEERYVTDRRGMFAAGTFNKASAEEVTELPNLPDVVNTEIWFDGIRFSMEALPCEGYARTLDLFTGEMERVLTVSVSGCGRIRLRFRRCVSMDQVHLITSRIEITPLEEDVPVRLLSGIDAQVTNSGAQHFAEVSKRTYEDRYLEMIMKTTQSRVQAAIHCVHRLFLLPGGSDAADFNTRAVDDRRKVLFSCEGTIPAGQTLVLEKFSAVHTTRDPEYADLSPEEAAGRLSGDGLSLLAESAALGYDTLMRQSAAVWERFWEEQDIRIDSENEFDQLAIRFALYHLEIMTRKGDPRIGIAAKGLSGEGYKGHSFWDTETFIFPYFQLTEPETARTLLEYRYLGLYGARKKAEENGYAGAMYPWESAWISDGEVTPYLLGVDIHTGKPLYCLTGHLEIHITADIIYALWNYYLSTGDEAFMERCGYEMILETARFWSSRLEWIPEHDRYEIRDVIGPDEFQEHVDNNAYTNYMAHFNLTLALSSIEELRTSRPEVAHRMEGIVGDLAALESDLAEKAARLYLPQPDPDTGIIPQFDDYCSRKELDLTPYKTAPVVGTLFRDYSFQEVQEYQVGKQADVVELLLQRETIVSEDLKEKNYYYYEARTVHDSSLSKAMHSIMASDIGLSEEAYRMFGGAARTDLGPQMQSSNDGIHAANMGGIWQDVVMGFGGVRLADGKLRIRPHLPAAWRSLRFPLSWRGSRLSVYITKDAVTIDNAGQPVSIVLGEREVSVPGGVSVYAI